MTLPSFEAVLRGVSFRPIEAKSIVNMLEEGAELNLEREPDNPHDPNAIKVIDPGTEIFIGYVAKEVAVDLAPYLDNGAEYRCIVNGRLSASVPTLYIEPLGGDEASSSGPDTAGE